MNKKTAVFKSIFVTSITLRSLIRALPQIRTLVGKNGTALIRATL